MTQNTQDLLQFARELNIPVISNDRRYWLVRTIAGTYYEDFLFNEYIGIGWNEIDNDAYLGMSQDELKEEISTLYPDDKAPGNIAAQILKFSNEIKKGDIVLFPSENSKYITFCEVMSSDVYFEEPSDDFEALLDEIYEESESQTVTPMLKRKPVKIIKTIPRSKLDPYIYPLLHSHHTITEAQGYSGFIERAIQNIYTKNGKLHFTINVMKKSELQATDLIFGLNTILESVDVYNALSDDHFEKRNFEIKLNVQSPGPIEFITEIAKPALVIGSFCMALFGGDFGLKLDKIGLEHQIKTNGLAHYIIEFIKERNRHDESIAQIEYEKLKLVQEHIKKAEEVKIEFEIVELEQNETAN